MMEKSWSIPFRDYSYQILASLAVSFLNICTGVNLTFPTIVLPQFILTDIVHMSSNESNNLNTSIYNTATDDVEINQQEASWIASLGVISMAVGSLLSGALIDRYGRKPTFLVASGVNFTAWLITGLTGKNISVLYLGRILAGVGSGMNMISSVYISEISHASIRTLLLPLLSVFCSVGILLTMVLGYFLPWRDVSFSSAAIAIISMAFIIFIPESPLWLWTHSKDSQKRDLSVINSLKWLYSNEQQCSEAFNHLKLSSELMDADKEEGNVKIWKPVILVSVLFLLLQLTGSFVVLIYSLQLFQWAGSVTLDPWISLVVIGVIRIILAILLTFLRIGRKKLLFWSGLGMAVSMFVSSTCLYFSIHSWVPVMGLVFYITCSAFGYLIIPWLLSSELLPKKIRGLGSGLLNAYAYIVMFIMTKMFLIFLSAVGISNVLFIFAVFSCISVLFVEKFIPETLGKTLEEIQEDL